ncbi:MAG: hypothetical protein ACKV2T_23845 [Kofleriaceae bacterium]
MLLGAGLSALIASNKNRNPIGWMILGLCFPLVGIIVISCQSTLPPPGAVAQLPTSRAV